MERLVADETNAIFTALRENPNKRGLINDLYDLGTLLVRVQALKSDKEERNEEEMVKCEMEKPNGNLILMTKKELINFWEMYTFLSIYQRKIHGSENISKDYEDLEYQFVVYHCRDSAQPKSEMWKRFLKFTKSIINKFNSRYTISIDIFII